MMIRFLIQFLLIVSSFYCTAVEEAVGGDFDQILAEQKAIPTPQRGFPEPMPYIETEPSIVSLHLPTFLNPPQPFSEMSRVSKFDPALPYTKLADEVYDITSWFPLEKMRHEGTVDERRWVYYNKTSGYIISYADQFLQSSVYLYVKKKLLSEGVRQRVSFVYLIADEKTSMNVESLSQSSHEVLWSSSAIVWSGMKSEFKRGNSELGIEMRTSENELSADVSLHFYLEGKLQFSSATHIAVNHWRVCEAGFSEEGKRGVMMIKVENINSLGQMVHLPPDYELFLEDVENEEDDPFGSDPFGEESKKRIITYRVPPDIIQLLEADENEDPFEDPVEDPFGDIDTHTTDENGLRNTKDRINISGLVAKNGVKIDAYFFPSVSYIIAYGTESEHDELGGLLTTLGPYVPHSYNIGIHFYEVDKVDQWQGRKLGVEDLLARNPSRLGSVGGVTRSGERVDIYRGENECRIEPIRGEVANSIDLNLILKIDMAGLKLEKKFELATVLDVPQVHYLGKSETTGRDLMMLIRVQEIEWKEEKQR